jgi:uncharacterized protein
MTQDGLILTHGAGSNRNAPLLIALDAVFTAAGLRVERVDLAFRQRGGAPHPATSAQDRDGLRRAVVEMRGAVDGRVYLGGHSYGGRQSSMLAAEAPGLVERLLLLSYPLHPPNRPDSLRTGHFPDLRTPALFVHGSKDPYGSLEEMETAIRLIPAPVELIEWGKAGHSLGKTPAMMERIVERFLTFVPA